MTYKAEAPSKQTDQIGTRPKRFWQTVGVKELSGGYAVVLDDRPVKTPMGNIMALPNQKLAQGIAGEWAAVDQHVEFEIMPFTRLAFAAIDRMGDRVDEAIAEAQRFAETDLLCYPSDYPHALVVREAQVWQPLIEWVRLDMGLKFIPNNSLIHKPQPTATLDGIAALLKRASPFELAAIMAAIPLFGSVILALAVYKTRLSGAAAFAASRIGEDFQVHTWGTDAEAAQRAGIMKAQAQSLEAWFAALG